MADYSFLGELSFICLGSRLKKKLNKLAFVVFLAWVALFTWHP